ncbi:YbbR-like domain-containing protein [Flavobacteriaceae bacterium]|nr:YbbR-like domain-containing protein [Flavobacteriaceae bacterium]
MIKKIKNIKSNIIQGKRLNVFVLFLSLSFLISLLSKLSNTYTQTLQFELQPTQIESNELIVSKRSKAINVTLSGRGFELLKYYISEPVIDVDFSQLNKDKTHYYWTERNQLEKIINHFDAKITVKAINPDTVLFPYDHQFIKKIPVTVLINTSFAVGYDLVNSYRAVPDSITVIGPESILKSMTTVRTKLLNLDAVNSNIDQDVNLDLPIKSNQLKYSHQTVSISAEVSKFTEGSVNVPVTIINVPDAVNINFFPKEIPVIFYATLKAYNSIDAGDFSVECDFNSLNIDNNYLNPVLVNQPINIKTAKLKVTQLEYVITPKND